MLVSDMRWSVDRCLFRVNDHYQVTGLIDHCKTQFERSMIWNCGLSELHPCVLYSGVGVQDSRYVVNVDICSLIPIIESVAKITPLNRHGLAGLGGRGYKFTHYGDAPTHTICTTTLGRIYHVL